MANFPHLNDDKFPGLSNVDVYKFQNTFDYTRWQPGTKLKLCNVNWNSDYDNVVKFGDDSARDEYFESLEGFEYVLTTEFWLQTNSIKLPLPFTTAQRFNYLVVYYQEVNLPYETQPHIFHYFINSETQLAPNTTAFEIQLDVWTQFINDCEIKYMQLERGHAPLAAISADDYLQDPFANSEYLLVQDVNFGSATISRSQDACVINEGEMYAVIASSANVRAGWGTSGAQSWFVPHFDTNIFQGVLNNNFMFCLKLSDFEKFIANANETNPQFLATIQAIMLIPAKIITLGERFTFNSVSCWTFSPNNAALDSITLTKENFGYNEKYENLAKLYTSPYAQLEISLGSGISKTIKIEDTHGKISPKALVSLAFPFISLELMFDFEGANENTFVFRNINESKLTTTGRWYDTILQLQIPTYAITQGAGVAATYENFYTWIQGYDSNSRTLEWNNTNADLSISNNATAISAAEDAQLRSNVVSLDTQKQQQAKLDADYRFTYTYNNATFEAGVDYTQASTDVSVASGIATSVVSGVSATATTLIAGTAAGAATGSVVPGAGTIAGAVIGAATAAVGVGVSVFTANASMTNTISNSQAVTQAAINRSFSSKEFEKTYIAAINGIQRAGSWDIMKLQNNAARTQTVASANTAKSIAASQKQLADNSIRNSYNQANLTPARKFGVETANGDAVVKPLGAFFNIVTQRDGEIAQAGDYMLRFGYALNQNWNFKTFNVMQYFSFWKCSDVWINTSTGIIEGAQELIKSILLQGVTIWSNPDKIGKVSIYENGVLK